MESRLQIPVWGDFWARRILVSARTRTCQEYQGPNGGICVVEISHCMRRMERKKYLVHNCCQDSRMRRMHLEGHCPYISDIACSSFTLACDLSDRAVRHQFVDPFFGSVKQREEL